MQKGRILDTGKSAEVYELANDRLLKLLFEYTGEGLGEYELGIVQAVFEAGAPSPKPLGYVRTMGRDGVIFEKVHGNLLFSEMERHPYRVLHYAREMAKLHARIHACTSQALISQYDAVKNKIGPGTFLPPERKEQVLDHLAGLPDGTSICHGDYHPKNIFLTLRGYIAIDWAEAYLGNSAGDVARTCLILASPSRPSSKYWLINQFITPLKKRVLTGYLNEYIRLTGIKRSDINQWVIPVAAAKLEEGNPDERDWLIKVVNQKIKVVF